MATRPARPKTACDLVRNAAFLRGVSPMNAKMSELARSFAEAGFTRVATVLSSGNVVFSAPPAPEAELARAAEAAMRKRMGRSFSTIVRPIDEINRVLASDPYASYCLAPEAKRVVTFLRVAPRPAPDLPIEEDGARIMRLSDRIAFSAYVPSPKGPVFMTLLERTFGRDITSRTWETLRKVSAASAG
ncbi:MAG TPA: DUF1697 domain-containing protein [Anaeromyxobacteraceae bacterium]|nr:DUF1697 domain-containing protein [Anaeromyxobacteraceae bacterium]